MPKILVNRLVSILEKVPPPEKVGEKLEVPLRPIDGDVYFLTLEAEIYPFEIEEMESFNRLYWVLKI